MISKRDQAAQLRELAQKQGIIQKDAVLTFSSLMKEKRSPLRVLANVLKVLAVLLVLGTLAAGGYFFFENNKKDKVMISVLAEKSEHLKNELTVLHDRTQSIEADVVKNVKENQELNKAVEDLHSTNKQLQDNYNKIAQDKQVMEKALQEAGNKISVFEKNKQDLQVQTHAELRYLQAQIKDLKSNLSEAPPRIQTALAASTRESTPLQAKPVVAGVSAGQANLVQGIEAEGKILLVNQNLQFVIVDMGTKRGVRLGSRLTVLRDGFPVETLKVIEVRPEVSAAESKSSVYGLHVGDKIKVQ